MTPQRRRPGAAAHAAVTTPARGHAKALQLDDARRTQQDGVRDRDSHRPRNLQIDNQLVRPRRLDRQIVGAHTVQDSRDILRGAPLGPAGRGAVRHQSSGFDRCAAGMHHRHLCSRQMRRQLGADPTRLQRRRNEQRRDLVALHLAECARKVRARNVGKPAHLDAEPLAGRRDVVDFDLASPRHLLVVDDPDPACERKQLAHQFDALRGQLMADDGDTSDRSTGSRQRLHEVQRYGVVDAGEHDRNGGPGVLRRLHRPGQRGVDHFDLRTHQVFGQAAELAIVVFGVPGFDQQIAAALESGVAQPLLEGRELPFEGCGGTVFEQSDDPRAGGGRLCKAKPCGDQCAGSDQNEPA